MAVFGPPPGGNTFQRHQPARTRRRYQNRACSLYDPRSIRRQPRVNWTSIRRRYPGQRHQIARKTISWQSVSWFTYRGKRRKYHVKHPIAQCRFELIGSISVKERGKISYSPQTRRLRQPTITLILFWRRNVSRYRTCFAKRASWLKTGDGIKWESKSQRPFTASISALGIADAAHDFDGSIRWANLEASPARARLAEERCRTLLG